MQEDEIYRFGTDDDGLTTPSNKLFSDESYFSIPRETSIIERTSDLTCKSWDENLVSNHSANCPGFLKNVTVDRCFSVMDGMYSQWNEGSIAKITATAYRPPTFASLHNDSLMGVTAVTTLKNSTFASMRNENLVGAVAVDPFKTSTFAALHNDSSFGVTAVTTLKKPTFASMGNESLFGAVTIDPFRTPTFAALHNDNLMGATAVTTLKNSTFASMYNESLFKAVTLDPFKTSTFAGLHNDSLMGSAAVTAFKNSPFTCMRNESLFGAVTVDPFKTSTFAALHNDSSFGAVNTERYTSNVLKWGLAKVSIANEDTFHHFASGSVLVDKVFKTYTDRFGLDVEKRFNFATPAVQEVYVRVKKLTVLTQQTVDFAKNFILDCYKKVNLKYTPRQVEIVKRRLVFFLKNTYFPPACSIKFIRIKSRILQKFISPIQFYTYPSEDESSAYSLSIFPTAAATLLSATKHIKRSFNFFNNKNEAEHPTNSEYQGAWN